MRTRRLRPWGVRSHAAVATSATVDNSVNRLWGRIEGKGGTNMLGTMLMEVREKLEGGKLPQRRRPKIEAAA